jgi:hypothetical protein
MADPTSLRLSSISFNLRDPDPRGPADPDPGFSKICSTLDGFKWSSNSINARSMERLNQGNPYPLLDHPETNMSPPGLGPGSPESQESPLAKSYSNSLYCCCSEPLHGPK